MGFNKRIVTKESILILDDKGIKNIFNADALITDEWSSKFLELFTEGHSKDNIIKKLENESTKS